MCEHAHKIKEKKYVVPIVVEHAAKQRQFGALPAISFSWWRGH